MSDTISIPVGHIHDPSPKADIFSLYGKYLLKKSQAADLTPSYTHSEGVPMLMRAKAADAPESDAAGEVLVPIFSTRGPNADKPVVGILGAGTGGLYAGMMLTTLGIPFEILEAQNRTGGRLFTYQFDDPKYKEYMTGHDYYDVGAMRYPKTNIMTRTFNLFNGKWLNTDGINIKDKVIQYKFADVPDQGGKPKGNTFRMYNGIRKRAKDIPATGDVFGFAQASGGDVDKDYIEVGASKLLDDALQPFVSALVSDMEKKPRGEAGLKNLMRFDQYSTRGFLSDCKKVEPTAINWMETMTYSTGWFDRSLSETVFETLCFGAKGPLDVDWYCLDGGSQVLTDKMTEFITKAPKVSEPIKFKNTVRGIRAADIGPDKKAKAVTVDVSVAQPGGGYKVESKTYDHVVSSLPLPTMRTLNIDDARLDFEQKLALRTLQYGPSIKIGMKFKSNWWTTWKDNDGAPLDIIGGQSYSDRSVRTVVYPSYGLKTNTNVLIASYCWTHDAERLGALMNAGQEADDRLKELVLRDLAIIHNIKYEDLEKEYLAHFAFDWTHNPLTQGAFAFFGPGEFSTVYRALTVPACDGRLHFAGEALSVRHAWVVGALDSAWRAVMEILSVSYPEKLPEFFKNWGSNAVWDDAPEEDQPAGGPAPWTTPGTEPLPQPDSKPRNSLYLRHLIRRKPELFEPAA